MKSWLRLQGYRSTYKVQSELSLDNIYSDMLKLTQNDTPLSVKWLVPEHFYFENHKRGDFGGRSLDGADPFDEATIQHHNIRAAWYIIPVNHSVTRLGAVLPGLCWNWDQFDWGHNVELQIIRMDNVHKPSKFQHNPKIGASFPKSHTAGLFKVNEEIFTGGLISTHLKEIIAAICCAIWVFWRVCVCAR